MVGIFNILGFSERICRQSGLKGLYTASRTFKRRFLESLGRVDFGRIVGFTRELLICLWAVFGLTLAVFGHNQGFTRHRSG